MNVQRDEQQLAQIQRGNAEKNAESLQATVTSLTKSRQELLDRLSLLERDVSNAAPVMQQLTDARHSENDLRSQLAELRVKYEECRVKTDE